MDVSNLLDQLNEAQREAVAAPESHLLVLAGAGSGKTRVLVRRIAWLLQVEKVSPFSILAVTFTNKAAAEMRSRIEQTLDISTRGLWIGTFHSLAHRLLKIHWQEANLPQQFQILDSDDQLQLIKRLIKQADLDSQQFQPKALQQYINQHKNEGVRADNVQHYGDAYSQTMQQLYRDYEASCQRSGMVDFGEILLRSHELWLKRPDVLAHYQQRFRHILVDEFQDTNTIQYAWLRVLAGQTAYMTAVGDDDQSIYGWRGAKIENIQRFSEDFNGAKIVRLEQNYRSTATILAAANSVIQHNQSRLGKALWTDGEQGETIDLYAAINEYDEARYVVERIEELLKDKACLKEQIAVLYRSNAQSRVLEEQFILHGLAYRIYGGQRFYERMEIKDALAYLRLIANPLDDAAFERVVNRPARGIGAKTLQVLRDFARDEGCGLWQAVKDVETRQLLSGRALASLQSFQQLIEQLQETARSVTLEALCTQVVKATGLIEHYQKEKGEAAQNRVDNLNELANASAQYIGDEQNELSALQQFLDDVALDSGDNQADETQDAVQLMTLHSAKGLEFSYVFMVGMEENLFPSRLSLEETGRLEEERRLCYVGITRAMRQLFFSYAEVRRLYGEERFNTMSRFIRECPEPLIRELKMQASVKKPVATTRLRLVQETQNHGFSLGQRVGHAVFGEGVILHFEGQGASSRVQVNFNDVGSKWLVLEFAKLKAL